MTDSNVSSIDDRGQEQQRELPDELTDAAGEPEILGDTAGSGPGGTAAKDPEQWVTGDEPMTGAQKSYLDTLAREAGETLGADLTKAEASQAIDRLQKQTGRGT